MAFKVNPDHINKVVRDIKKMSEKAQQDILRKVTSATRIVYSVAKAKRPKITSAAAKTNPNRYFRRDKTTGKVKEYRVSDPNAELGVPVDTGALQASITMTVTPQGEKVIGKVEAGHNVPYAIAVEYGTSKMKARPFMRPALNLNREVMKRILEEKPKP